MYYAIERSLFGDQERQVEQLGGVGGSSKAGDEGKTKPDSVKARYTWLREWSKCTDKTREGLRKCLALAQEVTDENDEHFQYQRTVLESIDEALRESKEYHNLIRAQK